MANHHDQESDYPCPIPEETVDALLRAAIRSRGEAETGEESEKTSQGKSAEARSSGSIRNAVKRARRILAKLRDCLTGSREHRGG